MRLFVILLVVLIALVMLVGWQCAGLPADAVATIPVEVRLTVRDRASGRPIEGATILIGRSLDMDTPAERDQIARLHAQGTGYMAACAMARSDHLGNVTLTLRPRFSWAPTPIDWITHDDRPPPFYGVEAVRVEHEGYVPQLQSSPGSSWTWILLEGDRYRAELGEWLLAKP